MRPIAPCPLCTVIRLVGAGGYRMFIDLLVIGLSKINKIYRTVSGWTVFSRYRLSAYRPSKISKIIEIYYQGDPVTCRGMDGI